MTPDARIREHMRAHRLWENVADGRGQWVGVLGNRQDLASLFAAFGHTRGAEIGTQRGLYSEVLCRANPGLHLTCIDPWSTFGGPGQTDQNRKYASACARLHPYAVTILRMTSLEALAHVADRSLDFVFIDGDHRFDYVCPDLIFWSRKVKSGGIVAAHDYAQWYEVGVISAVDAYTFCHDIRPRYVTLEALPTAFWVNP